MRRLASVLLLAGAMTALATAHSAAQLPDSRNFQDAALTGIGYNGALPDAQLGAGLFRFIGRGIGVFANAHMTSGSLKDNVNYCPEALQTCDIGWVVSERNDQQIRAKDEWLAVNAGGMFALSRELAVMIGGGAARATRYVEFLDDESDPELRITPTGSYYVDDELNSKWKPQVVAGALFRAGRSLAFSGGYETALNSVSVGVYLMF